MTLSNNTSEILMLLVLLLITMTTLDSLITMEIILLSLLLLFSLWQQEVFHSFTTDLSNTSEEVTTLRTESLSGETSILNLLFTNKLLKSTLQERILRSGTTNILKHTLTTLFWLLLEASSLLLLLINLKVNSNATLLTNLSVTVRLFATSFKLLIVLQFRMDLTLL